MASRFSLFLLAALAALAQAPYRSLASGYGTASLPNTAAFNGLTSARVEFRYVPAGTSGRIVGFGDILLNQGAGVISATSFFGGSETITLNYGSATDIIVRFQQNADGAWLDAWTADGSLYIQGQSAAQPFGTVDFRNDPVHVRHNGGGSGGTTGSLAWVRVYPSVVGTRLTRGDTVPTNGGAASPLVFWQFEGSGSDSGANSVLLSMTSAGYVSTPVAPQVGEPFTIRTGTAAPLDCSGTAADSYKWRYIGTSRTVRITSPTSATTTATGLDAFGEYVFRCEAVINNVSAITNLRVGAVATNAAGVVVPPSSELDFLLAPMLRGDASPWSFYDKNRRRKALLLAPQIITSMQADIATPLSGTISLTNGSATVTGSGTSFQSQYGNGAQLLVYYDRGSGVIGRHRMIVSSVASDTSMTLTQNWPKSSQSGVQHQRWGTGDGSDANTRWTDSLNYYDNVLALYVSYYKTGLSQIAQYADQIAEYWWLYLDYGHADQFAAPRLMSWEGLMVAAERGVLSKADIHAAAQQYSWDAGSGGAAPGYRNYIGERNTATAYQNFYFGARESGYSWRFGVASGRLHPTEGTRTTWATRLSDNVQNHYRDYQCKSSNPANAGRCRTPEGAFRWQDDFRGGDFVGGYAEEPWHTGIVMQGLIRYHRWTGNATAQTVIEDWVENLMTNTQLGGPSGAAGMYMATTPSDFAGIPCRRHFYTSAGGTETALTSGLSQGGGCSGGADSVYGGREVNNEIISSYGYAYRLTNDADLKTRGDDVFGATWGWDDGFGGQWAWSGVANPYKSHGQSLCCNDSYLVDRLGSAAADITATTVPFSVKFTFSSVPSSAKFRLTVTQPKGTSTTTTCTESPCAVNVDSTQGPRVTFLTEYLSAGDVVLARGEQQSSTIQ
jgi:hypothetical protein